MSIFSKIKDAIFHHKSAAPDGGGQAPGNVDLGTTPGTDGQVAQADTTQAASTPVDVDQVLSNMAQEQGNPNLNYKSSIVDLMKMLGLDSSLDNRKQLASELGYSGATDGSAEMNMWLSKAVMKELAQNGGNVSASLMA
jgi:Domain of unknown function (DUF3597)